MLAQGTQLVGRSLVSYPGLAPAPHPHLCPSTCQSGGGLSWKLKVGLSGRRVEHWGPLGTPIAGLPGSQHPMSSTCLAESPAETLGTAVTQATFPDVPSALRARERPGCGPCARKVQSQASGAHWTEPSPGALRPGEAASCVRPSAGCLCSAALV